MKNTTMKASLRIQLSKNTAGWVMAIQEKKSCERVLEVSFTHEDLGKLLSTSRIEAFGFLDSSSKYGKVVKVDSALMPFVKDKVPWKDKMDAFQSVFEMHNSGWELQREAFSRNRLRLVDGKYYYEFTIKRWIEE